MARLCMRLWFREMLEPTGLWSDEINNDIKPAHKALMLVLGRHIGVAEADDDLSRLAFSVVGLALQLMIARDVIEQISPQLIATGEAIDTWMERLIDFAEAIVATEKTRRMKLAPPKKSPSREKKA